MELISPKSAGSREPARSHRDPGAIVLLSCYELGHQPIGIAQPLGFLEQAGYRPAGLDIAVEDLDENRLARARFVGISVPMHTALRLGVRAAELIRDLNPGVHICFYGLYASLNAEYLLHHRMDSGCPIADTVIGGEYELPLVDLIHALDRGSGLRDLEGISLPGRVVGPYLRRRAVLTDRPNSRPISPNGQKDLPVFPPPNRAGLPPLNRYARLDRGHAQRDGGALDLVGYVEASRGCLHHCLHCPIVPVYEGRLFLVPEEVVLEDIRGQVQAGATHITFGDPDFLNGPGHSLRIVRAMRAEFPRLTFDFTAKVEHLLKRRALLPEFADLGCLFVISAIESFSDLVLSSLQKGHTRADIVEAIGLLEAAGLTLRPSFVAFTPWTTLEDYLDMLEVVEQTDLIEATDPVQFSIRLLVPPGSALLTHPAPGSPPVQTFITGLDQAGFQYQWKHPDPRMDDLHQVVSALVEQAAGTQEEARATFARLRRSAYEMAGRPVPEFRIESSRPARRRPRLTESWFCCAEPMQGQFRPLRTKREDGV